MTFFAITTFANPDGDITTIWPVGKFPTPEDAEPEVRAAVTKARRSGGVSIRAEVVDDVTWRPVWRGRFPASIGRQK